MSGSWADLLSWCMGARYKLESGRLDWRHCGYVYMGCKTEEICSLDLFQMTFMVNATVKWGKGQYRYGRMVCEAVQPLAQQW